MKFRTYFKTVGLCSVFFLFSIVMLVSPAQAKETLIIGMQDDTVSLDPAKAYERVSLGITKQLYETLVTFKDDNFEQPSPQLAESWDISDDGTTWTFHLRKDTSFSSGNPVTADAVVFSLQRALKLESDSSWLLTQFGMTQESITKIDDTSIQIVLDKAYAPALFLSCLAFNVASILDDTLVMQHEQDGDMGSAWLDTNSAGSGPFALEERIIGETYTLTANAHYTGATPQVSSIIIKSVDEPIEQAFMLEKEEIDIAWDLSADQARRLQSNPDVNIYTVPTLYINYMEMELGYEPFKKAEVRDAVRYAIDYEGLIDFVLSGAAERIHSFIPKGFLGYSETEPYQWDIEKAKALLAEAGYPDGFDLELACLNYLPWVDVALKIKSDLSKVGIKVSIVELDDDELLDLIGTREFQMYIWEWLPDYLDPDANAKPFGHPDMGLMAWESQYVNEEVSTLVEQAAEEANPKNRAELYKRVSDILLDDGPFVFLYSSKRIYGVGYEANDLLGTPSTLWVNFPPLK